MYLEDLQWRASFPPTVVENPVVVARHFFDWHKKNSHGFLGLDGSDCRNYWAGS